jgi:hypothetical protein
MKTVTHPYSAFLRGPGNILPELETADVVLERRDEEDLVLTSQHRAAAREEGLAVTIHLVREVVSSQPELLTSLFSSEFPWLKWLPADDRSTASEELLAELEACASTGILDPFVRTMREWRETAMIWSDPELVRRLQGSFTSDGTEIARPIPS